MNPQLTNPSFKRKTALNASGAMPEPTGGIDLKEKDDE